VGQYIEDPSVQDFIGELHLPERLQFVETRLAEAESPEYLRSLVGTIGVDPFQPSMHDKLMASRLAEAT
jgi:hypothetical protein